MSQEMVFNRSQKCLKWILRIAWAPVIVYCIAHFSPETMFALGTQCEDIGLGGQYLRTL